MPKKRKDVLLGEETAAYWELQGKVREAYVHKLAADTAKADYDAKRDELVKAMLDNGFESVRIDYIPDNSDAQFVGSDAKKVTAKVVTTTKIVYDADKVMNVVEDKFGKTVRDEVVPRDMRVTDTTAFLKYMQEIGADPVRLSKMLDTKRNVDEAAIDRMYELGELEMGDLKDAITVQEGKPYVRFTARKA